MPHESRPRGPHEIEHAVRARLDGLPRRVVACSGGVDSLLLADLAHQHCPEGTVIAHSVTPAVPEAATDRTVRTASELGWRLRLVRSAEFADERYLANPVDRCFHCKSHLYDELGRMLDELPDLAGATVLSGANVDDLGEYRPGLRAAAEHDVRHPWVEAGVTKAGIRAVARTRGRDWHDLPAAPCLASRLYTGTAVTPALMRAVERGEIAVRELTGLAVVRCRVRGDQVRIEVGAHDRDRVTAEVLDRVADAMRAAAPQIEGAALDDEPYAPGRAFVSLAPPGRPGATG
ncbi:MAG: hypothetical protein L0I76_05175 [Pseudonocardia sp.]|nr:hypothetical protein [Pseudonocardia sp.]